MSEYESLMKNSSARIIVTFEMFPKDKDGLVRPQYFSTARLYTEEDENPPNLQFNPAILPGWTLTRRIASTGSSGQAYLAGGSSADLSAIVARDENGALADLLGYIWKNTKIVSRIGGAITTSGDRYRYSDFVTLFTGTLRTLSVNSDGNLEFTSAGTLAELDDDILSEVYYALGSAIRCDPGYATSPNGPDIDTLGNATIIMITKIYRRIPAIGSGIIIWKGRPPQYNNWQIYIRYDTDEIVFSTENGMMTADISNIEVYDRVISIVITAYDGHGDMYVGTPGSPSLIASAEIGSLTSNTNQLVLGAREAQTGVFGTKCEQDVCSAAIFNRAISITEIPIYSSGIISDAQAVNGLVRYWPIIELDGSSSYPTAGTYQLLLEGGASFVSSLTGDDPLSGSSIDGSSKPLLICGEARNMSAIMVDSRRAIYQVSALPLSEITRVYSGMSELYPNEQQMASGPDTIEIIAAPTDSIVLDGSLTARRYIPSQQDPPAIGQRIEIAGAVAAGGANNGIYRIISISDDYKIINVADENGIDPAGLINEILPSGAYVGTVTGDAHYTILDLSDATIQLPSSGFGEITVDGSAQKITASDAIALISGKTVITNRMTFDPYLTVRVSELEKSDALNSTVRRQVIEAIAISAFAWIKTTREGTIELITIQPPSNDPKITMCWSRPSILSQEKIAPVIATISGFQSRPMAPPPSLLQVGYDRTWTIPQNIPGFVPQQRQALLSRPFRWLERGNPNERKSSLSIPERRIETYLPDRPSANQWLDLGSGFYFNEWSIASLAVVGYPSATIDVGDDGIIQHPHPNHGITDGEPCKIIAIDENPLTGQANIEVIYEPRNVQGLSNPLQ